ncbi:GOLD domain-containing protein [Meloidogyne graminicola]|uniref:GOLD domain-containing protein n=1 Tax=Meloidogyne graminicola TaxID=189291 RepID=A0A8S9ZU17_9BILA|nr:GOLD domain-containing protein [Meloidogyne graminicola]
MLINAHCGQPGFEEQQKENARKTVRRYYEDDLELDLIEYGENLNSTKRFPRFCAAFLAQQKLYDPNTKAYGDYPTIGMHVEVKDPEEKIILSKLYTSEGLFTFTSHSPGEHLICLYSNTTAWFSGAQLRVYLDIQVGEHAQDYQQVAAKDKLNDLQLRVRQLLDQVEQITKEQNYQRYREERFRQTSEGTNSRVLWWSAGQTIVLLLTGWWQIRHLRGFFEAKKLV